MVTGLGYIGIESRTPDDWVQFGVDVLGLQQGTNCADGVISLRMDDRAARIMVQPGSREGLAFLGWEVAGARQLETLFDRLLAHGCAPAYASEDECAERQVQGLIRCVDPTAIPLEFFCGQLCVKERFQPSRAISVAQALLTFLTVWLRPQLCRLESRRRQGLRQVLQQAVARPEPLRHPQSPPGWYPA